MTIDPSELLQLVMGILLGVIGWSIRQVLFRLEQLEKYQNLNTGRLIRIETRLGISENGNHDTA